MSNEPEKPKVEHVERSRLPWERTHRTECGLVIDSLDHRNVITRDQVVTKVKVQGIQRASLSTCMTCLETVQRWPTWDQNPATVISRAYSRMRWSDRDAVEEARTELRALAALVEVHRDEFNQLIADIESTTDLAARRTKKRRTVR